MKKIKFAILMASLGLTAVFAACTSNTTGEPKVKYYVDGQESATAPDKNFYKAVSIESNSK